MGSPTEARTVQEPPTAEQLSAAPASGPRTTKHPAVTRGRCAQRSEPWAAGTESLTRWRALGAAVREYHRRRTNRAARLRRTFGRLGALLSGVSEPTHQRA
jgi:hypothetical protein